nr:Druantia anti-phage system protein DruA [Verrucomicrobium sp. 3C]
MGDDLRQVIAQDGQAVALLVWGPACYALKDRDRWIGWSAVQRVERLKLIVQNRRFLLLTPRGSRHPIWPPKLWERPCGRCRPSGGIALATLRFWPRASPIRRPMRGPATRRATGKR